MGRGFPQALTSPPACRPPPLHKWRGGKTPALRALLILREGKDVQRCWGKAFGDYSVYVVTPCIVQRVWMMVV